MSKSGKKSPLKRLGYFDNLLQIINASDKIFDIPTLTKLAGIGNSLTTKCYLLELYIAGQLTGFSIDEGWMFASPSNLQFDTNMQTEVLKVSGKETTVKECLSRFANSYLNVCHRSKIMRDKQGVHAFIYLNRRRQES